MVGSRREKGAVCGRREPGGRATARRLGWGPWRPASGGATSRPADGLTLAAELDAAKRHIGELSMVRLSCCGSVPGSSERASLLATRGRE